MADGNFWDSFSQWGPGLVQTAGGWYTNKEAQDEAKKRAAAIGGDATAQGLNAAQQAELKTVGNVDPAQLFAQQQGLMAPVKEKGQADLMRDLYRKGMIGLATDQQAGQGQTWQNAPGARSNPLAAAYFAAQAGADQKAAYDAIKNASDLRTAGISRVSQLGSARQGAMQNAATALPARTASPFKGMLGGLTGLLGNKDAMSAIGKWFKDDSNAAGKVGAGQMPGQTPGVNTSGGYGPNVGPQMPEMPQIQAPQFGMDDLYGGGIFAPQFDFSDMFGGNDYGWNTGWDLGGGVTWSGEYE